jgi:spoIIIJ-associated protein
MSGFFSKIFGGKKKEAAASVVPEADSASGLVENVMHGLIERTHLDLTFELRTEMNGDIEDITVEISGADQALLTEKEGALLDSFQLFIKRVLQHQMSDARVNVNFDCNGFREESNKSLVELAEKLKDKAIEQGRSVYFRALPPKDRKVVHQYLASDDRVRSRSVGDGLYKKIKIYPVKSGTVQSSREMDDDMSTAPSTPSKPTSLSPVTPAELNETV